MEMTRSRKKTAKVIENDRQRAKTASPIRKRPAVPRRVVSQLQSYRQGLDRLAEAASVVEPANIPPPSGQGPAATSNADDEDEEDLPTVSAISRRASAKSQRA
jgi:hypothetical protein